MVMVIDVKVTVYYYSTNTYYFIFYNTLFDIWESLHLLLGKGVKIATTLIASNVVTNG